MNNRIHHLAHHDQRAIQSLMAILENLLEGDIAGAILFGSKARGDDTPDSDIDVLILTNDESWSLKHKILVLGARVSLEQDVLFNIYPLSLARWKWMEEIQHPLYRTVRQEGLDLLPEKIAH
jgi:predicted nucleotidyltransferase